MFQSRDISINKATTQRNISNKKQIKKVLKMRSLLFEKKYDIALKNFSTIEEINKCVEKKEGRKLDYRRSDNIIMAKGGSVFKINTTDPGKVIDNILSKKSSSK